MTYDPQNRRRDPLMGQTSVQPPIQPQMDGYLGKEEPQSEASWQKTGYHMEDQPCDDDEAWVLDEFTDTMLAPPDEDPPLTDP